MATSEASLGSIANPIKFKKQDYQTLLEMCLQSKKLFTDSTFPAEQKSIGLPEETDPKKAITGWLRPKEITKKAVFMDTIGITDVCQGALGDCWLMAALSCLTMHPQLFVKVVPPNQSLSEPYAGIFRFKFWQYGEWVEVVVDDQLPTGLGRLLFTYSHTRNEFWSALVEKAYAKLNGSYGSLVGGTFSEGMEDFTGGIAYSCPVQSRPPPVFWRLVRGALSRGSLLGCYIPASSKINVENLENEGLKKNHVYAITGADKVQKASEGTLLYKLRNPHGKNEYTGPWSDNSKEWDDVDDSEKQRIDFKKIIDGEFWISAEDFSNFFTVMELCSVNPDMLEAESGPQTAWTITEHQGFWVTGSSAGGSHYYPNSFWKNPKYELILTEKDLDEDDEDEEECEDDKTVAGNKTKEEQKSKKCTLVVELLQKDNRQKVRKSNKINNLAIAFYIYKVPPERGQCLDSTFFSKKHLVATSGKHKVQRGVLRKVHLDPGNYVILPSTFSPEESGEFFIRIFSKNGNTLGETLKI